MTDRTHVIGFRLDDDVAKFVHDAGKARSTDFASGRINFSAEVNEFLRGLMSKIKPEVIGYSLIRKKEELRVQIEAIDAQARQLLGASTIEEWAAREKERAQGEAEVLEKQRTIRHGVKEEMLGELLEAWKNRHQNGNAYKKSEEVAWAKHRFQRQLRTIGWSPEEFIRRMQTEGHGLEGT